MSVDPQRPALHEIPTDTLYRLLEPVTVPSASPRASFINWGLSYECTPLAVFEPETEEQCELVLELARREGKTVRAAGVGHSPSDVACTSQFMLRTEKLSKIIEVSVKFSCHTCPYFHCAMHRHSGNLRPSIAVVGTNSISSRRHVDPIQPSGIA